MPEYLTPNSTAWGERCRANEVATQAGVYEEVAAQKAVEGILEAAETLGPKAVVQVKEALPADTQGEAAR